MLHFTISVVLVYTINISSKSTLRYVMESNSSSNCSKKAAFEKLKGRKNHARDVLLIISFLK